MCRLGDCMDFDKTFVNKTSSRNFKAQFWSFDLIFSVVIFSFAITVLAYTWFSLNSQLASQYGSTAALLQQQTAVLSQNLMSPGVPQNWPGAVNTLNIASWSGMSIGLSSAASSAAISS